MSQMVTITRQGQLTIALQGVLASKTKFTDAELRRARAAFQKKWANRDAYLHSWSKEHKAEIFTFDKQLKKLSS